MNRVNIGNKVNKADMGNEVHRVSMGNNNFNKVNKVSIEEKKLEEEGRGEVIWTHKFQQFVMPIWC